MIKRHFVFFADNDVKKCESFFTKMNAKQGEPFLQNSLHTEYLGKISINDEEIFIRYELLSDKKAEKVWGMVEAVLLDKGEHGTIIASVWPDSLFGTTTLCFKYANEDFVIDVSVLPISTERVFEVLQNSIQYDESVDVFLPDMACELIRKTLK